ncbi:MAG: ABC transporter permease [Prolixibacteraceae bacterium]
MLNISIALKTELLKLKHARIFLVIIAFHVFIPIMMGLLMLLSQYPETAAKMGLVGTKAALFATNNWDGYLAIINQVIAVVGLIGFGFVISWIFGREFIENTMTSTLALPIQRGTIVLAKYIVAVLICTGLAVVLYSASIGMGKIIHIPGWSNEIASAFTSKFFITAGMSILVSLPVGFMASWGRGIVAPIGFVIVTLIMSQFVALAGLGPYFPWAIPGVYTVPAGTQGMELHTASYLIVLLTALLAVGSTIIWWNRAEHH